MAKNANKKGLSTVDPDAKIATVSKMDLNRASKLLAQYREAGKSIQHDLFPSINKAMVEAGAGSMFAGIAVAEAQKDAVPSTLQKGEFSDTLVLTNIQGERETAIFYASNKGAKAKLSGIRQGQGVLIYYRGDVKSRTAGFNDWHDFAVESFPEASQLVAFLEEAAA